MKILFFTLAYLLLVAEYTYSQDNNSIFQKLPSGISIQYGLGKIAIKDYYISEEKYSGYTTNLYLSFNKFHYKYHSRIEMDYRYGEKVKNNNVHANIHQFSFNRINLYPVANFNLLSKHASLYLGPSTDLFFHYRQQNIAGGGNAQANAISLTALLSAGFNTEVLYLVSENFNISLSNNLSVLSLGFKIFDFTDSEVQPVKFLTPFTGLNLKNSISVQYQIVQPLSVYLGYQFNLCRITAWDKFIFASDNVFITISFNF
ncbi:MAG: hypothetical protein JXJ22_14340 [Bacteroidales bacterium]|nr:hypothetical protein [Bacteroidales bacterium]